MCRCALIEGWVESDERRLGLHAARVVMGRMTMFGDSARIGWE